jgi:hypothetical protein
MRTGAGHSLHKAHGRSSFLTSQSPALYSIDEHCDCADHPRSVSVRSRFHSIQHGAKEPRQGDVGIEEFSEQAPKTL